MALWMENGSEPLTESEKADLDAINALKESAALELKEKGNEFVKMGKKHYSDAVDCYTRAITQQVLGDSETSILFSNRAHVNLLLGNFRRALADAEKAIRLSPTNVKALYRAAKASMSLNLLIEARSYCENGIKCDPNNEELKKLKRQIDSLKLKHDQDEAQIANAVVEAQKLLSAIQERGLKMGKKMYRDLTGLRKPVLDKDNILHWPVLLLYAEVMSSDFIEDFCETDMFSSHLDMMFSESCPPLPWDEENHYNRKDIELYYQAGSEVPLSKGKILHFLLEGIAGAKAEDIGENDANENSNNAVLDSLEDRSCRWIKVNERKTLYEVLKNPNFIIAEIPVFYVVSRSSSFYNDFKSGKWSLPL